MIQENNNYQIFNHDVYSSFHLNENANKILQKGCDILRFLMVPFWISGGTLLGMYRDKSFIKDDTDIDVEVLGDTHTNAIYNNFNRDFELVREIKGENKFIYQQSYYHIETEILFDIFYFKKVGDKLISWSETEGCQDIYYPSNFMEKIQPIKFEGNLYPVIEPEVYLDWVYGPDWRTPIEKDKVIYNWGKNEHNN